MKIISGGSFIYFVKISLNKLLGLTVVGVRPVIVTSSAYVVICTSFGETKTSEVQMLNNVRDRIPLCGTPVLIRLSF